MDARGIERGEHPDQIIGNKQMRSSGPLHVIPIVFFQISHATVTRDRVPLSEGGNGRIVKHNKLGSPCIKRDRVNILLKIARRKPPPNDAFPICQENAPNIMSKLDLPILSTVSPSGSPLVERVARYRIRGFAWA